MHLFYVIRHDYVVGTCNAHCDAALVPGVAGAPSLPAAPTIGEACEQAQIRFAKGDNDCKNESDDMWYACCSSPSGSTSASTSASSSTSASASASLSESASGSDSASASLSLSASASASASLSLSASLSASMSASDSTSASTSASASPSASASASASTSTSASASTSISGSPSTSVSASASTSDSSGPLKLYFLAFLARDYGTNPYIVTKTWKDKQWLIDENIDRNKWACQDPLYAKLIVMDSAATVDLNDPALKGNEKYNEVIGNIGVVSSVFRDPVTWKDLILIAKGDREDKVVRYTGSSKSGYTKSSITGFTEDRANWMARKMLRAEVARQIGGGGNTNLDQSDLYLQQGEADRYLSCLCPLTGTGCSDSAKYCAFGYSETNASNDFGFPGGAPQHHVRFIPVIRQLKLVTEHSSSNPPLPTDIDGKVSRSLEGSKYWWETYTGGGIQYIGIDDPPETRIIANLTYAHVGAKISWWDMFYKHFQYSNLSTIKSSRLEVGDAEAKQLDTMVVNVGGFAAPDDKTKMKWVDDIELYTDLGDQNTPRTQENEVSCDTFACSGLPIAAIPSISGATWY